MSGQSGAVQSRGSAVVPRPLKATIPYQLTSKPPPSHPGKMKLHQQLSSGIRRAMSLDAIIGPYLQGQWLKEPEGHSCLSYKDKATQVSLRDGTRRHKRSASCGSTEHLLEVSPQWIPVSQAPLSTLVPRLRCSVEGLNQELEGVFICHPQNNVTFLEVPDGHRAPVPPQSCSSGSQSDPTSATTPLSSVSLSPSPCLHNRTESVLLSQPLLTSSSPGPNKSCCFQREPPEGCERVRVWDENCLDHVAFISSCPDLNKVNFTPHGGSAFCPVSLPVPLLSSMGMSFRGLSISPAGGPSCQGPSSCQVTFSNVNSVSTASESHSV
uniref:Protein FAM117A-like n=1 Tax=Cynoglossus semilaevis TaxID=244447 RepID=A0A3P8VP12_CYNSE